MRVIISLLIINLLDFSKKIPEYQMSFDTFMRTSKN